MSRLVKIGKNMVELAGLHGIWVGPNYLSGSKITLFYPKKPTVVITYELDKYAECDKDAKILEDAKKEFEKSLDNNKSKQSQIGNEFIFFG
jgi:hypothetical protein